MSTKGLGKGLGTLIPEDFDTSILVDEKERVQKLDITKVVPNADQPRKHFDEEALKQLSESIKRYGILQPIVVTPAGGNFTIIAGERRYRASSMAGLKTIPALVRSSEELERLEIALVENVQRVDLSPLEQAVSIARLHEQFSMSYQEIATRLGKAPTTVNNIVRLLQLPKEAQTALQEQDITEGHARAILSLKDQPDRAAELLKLIIQHGWSVRQAEQFAAASKEGVKSTQTAQKRINTETVETKKLGKIIKAPVSIKRLAKGGQLMVRFTSDEDLERIINQLIN